MGKQDSGESIIPRCYI